MTRSTIDFGIDLGVTTSAVAVWNGGRVEVVRNDENVEFTPSAVAVSGTGTVRVGCRARQRVEDDPDNATSEFHARMGDPGARTTFAASGVTMTPTELSAEVLKSLRSDVATRRGEDLDAAVVTVPASATLAAIDATVDAARLAGIEAVTVWRPVAATRAYLAHDDREIDREFWPSTTSAAAPSTPPS